MQQAKSNIRQLNLLLLIAFGALALMLVYWSVLRSDWLAARDDNPRLVELELRTRRGTIYDTNNQPLAWSEGEERVERTYAPASGAAVGYYSFRYGATGIEQGLDTHLRGTDGAFWNQFVRDSRHEARIGSNVRLTIDARWQALADAAMVGQQGAAVLISLPDHALRMMTSYPSFDPNLLDDQFTVLSDTVGAPLLNRATQGVYQPGGVLQPFLYAAALDRNWLHLDDLVSAGDQPIILEQFSVGCVNSAEHLYTYAETLRAVCPQPLFSLSNQTNLAELGQLFATFGFADDPLLPFALEAEKDRQLNDTARALIGQDTTTVTPLQVAIAWAGLANAGTRYVPHVVAALQTPQGQWQTQLTEQAAIEMVSAAAATQVIANLPHSGSIIEYSAFAIADTDGSQTIWYLALGPVPNPRYALVLVVEDGDIEEVREIGKGLIEGIISR